MFRTIFSVVLIICPAITLAETAVFAGGCFWCMEAPFEAELGVIAVRSGFAGGDTPNPTYDQVSKGATSYTESIEVSFDPNHVGYERLLEVYWKNTDPTDAEGQFCDRGRQYRPAIFAKDAAQRRIIEVSKQVIEAKLKSTIKTEILDSGKFYPADDYHQDYYRKNPENYRSYRQGCGRDKRLAELWGASSLDHAEVH